MHCAALEENDSSVNSVINSCPENETLENQSVSTVHVAKSNVSAPVSAGPAHRISEAEFMSVSNVVRLILDFLLYS